MLRRKPECQTVVRRTKLIFVIAEDWYFWSHRLPLARAAHKKGFDVIIATRVHKHAQQIRDEGFRLVPLYLSRESYSPLKEVSTILQLRRLYRAECPDIVHHVALKPILYGSIAALGLRKTKVINALAGLGYLVSSSSLKAALLRVPIWNAFKYLLRRPNCRVLLQNVDDQQLVTKELGVPFENSTLIRSAGVNCEVFAPSQEPEGSPVVMLASRMLWNKGIVEFVEAARMLASEGINARFVLVGDVDTASPSGMSRKLLKEWHDAGFVEWWGQKQDMSVVYQESTLICLPSHGGEGIPKVLLEAAACGRAIIASDVPGCRDIVRNDVNGVLVKAKDPSDLANAIRFLLANPALRDQMGAAGREIATREFAQEIVVAKTLALYDDLLRDDLTAQVRSTAMADS